MMAEAVALIRALDPPVFRLVEGVGSLAALKVGTPPPALPAVYVFPLARAGGPRKAMNQTSQNISVAIGVMIVVGAVQDARSGQASVDLQTAMAAVMAALYGVEPTSAHEPFEYVDGEIIEAKAGLVWWQDTFSTAYEQRSA